MESLVALVFKFYENHLRKKEVGDFLESRFFQLFPNNLRKITKEAKRNV